MASDQLSELIEEFEAFRSEFWDALGKRAEAARFSLVAKAYTRQGALPPKGLLFALDELPIDNPERLEDARQQISSAIEADTGLAPELDYLVDELAIHLLVSTAKAWSQAGVFPDAAKQFKQAEERRRQTEKRLSRSLDEERASEHEWHELAALFPDLTERMAETFRLHATVTEPLQLITPAVRLARRGDSAGAERALTIADNWTEGQGEIHVLLEKLVGFLPRWPALQEAVLGSPLHPASALEELRSWEGDPQRQSLLQSSSQMQQAIKDDKIFAQIVSMTDQNLVDGTRDDLQSVLVLQLYLAAAQEDVNLLASTCEHLQISSEQFGDDEKLRPRVEHLFEIERTRVVQYQRCLEEIAPFAEDPAVLGSAVRQDIETLLSAHQVAVAQLETVASFASQSTDPDLPQAVTLAGDPPSAGQPVTSPHSLVKTLPAVKPASATGDLGRTDGAQLNGDGSARIDQQVEVLRALRGARFNEAIELLERARSSTREAQERAVVARLDIVARACALAVTAGSSPSSQAVEDLIEAVKLVGSVDSAQGVASTRLAWASQECAALAPGLGSLLREIEIRRSFRNADRWLAEGQFVEASKSIPDTGQIRNGLAVEAPGERIWQDVTSVLPNESNQQDRLLYPIRALRELQNVSDAALNDANKGYIEDALRKLNAPLEKKIEELKEPEARRPFHPLVVWLSRVLTSWHGVRISINDQRTEQVLLALKQAELTCKYAREVALIADFGASEQSFLALVDTLDDATHSTRRSLQDALHQRIEEALQQSPSLAKVDRLISSLVALQSESDAPQQTLEALALLAKEQEDQGDVQLNPKGSSSPPPTSIEQLAEALPFYQRARLLALFEAVDTALSTQGIPERLDAKLTGVVEKGQRIRRLQAELDGALADENYVTARDKATQAKEEDLQWKGPSLEELNSLVESIRLRDEASSSLTSLRDRISSLWL